MISHLSLKQIQAPSVWLLSDQHKVGTRNQGKGLLEALNLPYESFSLGINPFLKALPRFVWPLSCVKLEEIASSLQPPWPNLIVAAGTVSSVIAAKIRKLSDKRSFVIALQNPRLDLKFFDLVIAPYHDKLTGENVLQTCGALHPVTMEKIAQETVAFRGAWDYLPQPLVAVLVGGPNRHLKFGERQGQQLAKDLKALHQKTGCGFLMTCSRRTPLKTRQIFENLSSEIPLFLWKGEGKTPYFAFLGLADYIIVTADSISMTSEASATDKPIFVYPLPGNALKFEAFHQRFFKMGISQPFQGELRFWVRAPFEETQAIAKEIKKRLIF